MLVINIMYLLQTKENIVRKESNIKLIAICIFIFT